MNDPITPMRKAAAAKGPKRGEADLDFTSEDRLALFSPGRFAPIDLPLVLTAKAWRHAPHPAPYLSLSNLGRSNSIVQCRSNTLLVS